MNLTQEMRDDYIRLYQSCSILQERKQDVRFVVDRILKHKDKYDAVSLATGVPWFIIAINHNMECSGDFTKHLHNGDPLTARTVHVPAGYPKDGGPPFSWEDSAIDAVEHEKMDQWHDWSLPGILFQLEGFNGYGYRTRNTGINSPYLWSFTNQYTIGKFVGDGVYKPNAVSKQVGAAAILRELEAQDHFHAEF